MSNLTDIRKGIFTSDCWRSFRIILIGSALLMLFKMKKLGKEYMIAGIAVLCPVDMWMVNKRYLYDDMFVDKAQRDTPQQMTETDKIICRDKALDYRVLNRHRIHSMRTRPLTTTRASAVIIQPSSVATRR